MEKDGKIFHESWHRISGQRVSLRSSVQLRRQFFRAAKWYVLHDPFSNNFYRLRPAAYGFISRLRADRTVEEAWKEAAALDPDEAPGQGDVIEILSQLYHANLLHGSLPPDSEKLFERHRKRQQRLLTSNLTNIMFIRIPLFDPEPILKQMQGLIRILLSPLGALVWLLVAGWGVKVAAEHFTELHEQRQGILAPENLFLLYLGLVFIKTIHEFGHASCVKRFGGEVHTMGIMFMIFNPLPYVDASSAWTFRNRWHRVLVGCGGMIFELFVAAFALFLWSSTSEGALHSLAYNIMFVASVSTVLFNINPLMRFDGYYILSDLLNIPNLHKQATDHLYHLVRRYAFGLKESQSPAATGKEATWLAVFGILSFAYRIVVFSTITLFVADRYLVAGMIMALFSLATWILVPLFKSLRYLFSSPELARTRPRALAASAGAFAFVVLVLGYLPVPSHFKAPGILKAVDYAVVSNRTAGIVEEILVPSGARVSPGDPLLRMENPELLSQIQEAEANLVESEAMYQKAMQEQQADMKPLESRIDFYTKRIASLHEDQEDLLVRSPIKGLWVSPEVRNYGGMWMPRGSALGQLINDDRFYLVSVVSQQDVFQLFSGRIRATEVKLSGQSDIPIPVTGYASIPMEQSELPSSALGFRGGGDIAIDVSDEKGVKTAEPFYEVRATVANTSGAMLVHGRSGKIRFTLANEPLARQEWRKLRQLLQKRYRI